MGINERLALCETLKLEAQKELNKNNLNFLRTISTNGNELVFMFNDKCDTASIIDHISEFEEDLYNINNIEMSLHKLGSSLIITLNTPSVPTYTEISKMVTNKLTEAYSDVMVTP